MNTDMLHNEGMYRVFQPDSKSPTREEAEVAFPAMQAMPIPYIEPQDVSNTVVFLASDDSRYITGTQLRVDAGGFVEPKPYGVEPAVVAIRLMHAAVGDDQVALPASERQQCLRRSAA